MTCEHATSQHERRRDLAVRGHRDVNISRDLRYGAATWKSCENRRREHRSLAARNLHSHEPPAIPRVKKWRTSPRGEALFLARCATPPRSTTTTLIIGKRWCTRTHTKLNFAKEMFNESHNPTRALCALQKIIKLHL